MRTQTDAETQPELRSRRRTESGPRQSLTAMYMTTLLKTKTKKPTTTDGRGGTPLATVWIHIHFDSSFQVGGRVTQSLFRIFDVKPTVEQLRHKNMLDSVTLFAVLVLKHCHGERLVQKGSAGFGKWHPTTKLCPPAALGLVVSMATADLQIIRRTRETFTNCAGSLCD